MNKAKYIALFTAGVLISAISAQGAVNLWYDDFSGRVDLDGNGDHKFFPPATPGVGQLSTNIAHEGTWYRRNKSDHVWNSMFSEAGASNGPGTVSLEPPADSVGGAALRTGYHGQSELWDHYTEINTGINLDTTNLIYTMTFRAKVQATWKATNSVGTGSVNAGWGWWDSTAPSNNFKWFASGSGFSNLTSEAWVTNSVSFVGARVAEQAGNSPLIVRFTQKGPQNTWQYETWVDWISIDGTDLYADWASSEGLTGVRTDDKDGDNVDDFTEWATGGDPNDDTDTGLVGANFIVDVNGTNRLAYVTPRQTNYFETGANYWLEGTDSLTLPAWTNAGWTAGTASGGFNAGYDAVTNHVGGVESNATQFIRLRVGHRGYNP
jgi:hypothetical protein